MAFDQTDVGSIRFLIGDAIMQFTRVVMNPGVGVANISQEVSHLSELCSHYTAQDSKYDEEMKAAIPEGYKPGWDPILDMDVRMKHFGCIVRSMCRGGVLTKPELPSSEFKPTATGRKVANPLSVTA